MGIIYKITNTCNGKIYVGKTTQDLQKRFKDHVYTALRYKDEEYRRTAPQSRLYLAMNAYGTDNFIIEVLETVCDSELDEREIYYIDKLHTRIPEIGYNISQGGSGGPLFEGHVHSQETRKKLSDKNYWRTHQQPKEMVDRRMQNVRSRMPQIQVLQTGEIFKNHLLLEDKYGGSSYWGLRQRGSKYRGLYIVALDEAHPDGYTQQEREAMIEEFNSDRHKKYSLSAKQAWLSMSPERREEIQTKSKNATSTKTPEQKREIAQKISEAAKRMWKSYTPEEKEQMRRLASERATLQHAQRTKEEKRAVNAKNSAAQKGKKIFKNVTTGEIKVICPKDFGDYDIGEVWVRCHKNGDLWED